jgi:hypothetical protein
MQPDKMLGYMPEISLFHEYTCRLLSRSPAGTG